MKNPFKKPNKLAARSPIKDQTNKKLTLSNPFGKLTGKDVAKKIDEYTEIYGEVLIGLHREFQSLQRLVQNHSGQLEQALKEIKQMEAEFQNETVSLRQQAEIVANAAQVVKESKGAIQDAEERISEFADALEQNLRLDQEKSENILARRAWFTSIIAIIISVGVLLWTAI